MVRSARSRWTLITAITALVVGATLASTPAQAATASIGVTVPVVYTDSWGSGIDVIGGGFTPSSTVTLSIDWVNASNGQKVHYGDTTTAASASGVISVIGWIPAMGPDSWADLTLMLSATSDAGDTSNAVAFDVRNPPGIETNAPSLTTAQFMDSTIGLAVQASGFTPGEAVAFSAVYNGVNLPAPSSLVADKSGSVVWQYVRTGVTAAGSVVLDATGATAHWRATVAITGPTIGGSTSPADPATTSDPGVPAQVSPVQATPRALPVVSG
ncbi:hypothetical protein [Leifsonia aquatica]|uniref:hypothetical protein n=1 Tax=Leifsonia aquatica TaxID=144185 RepID=UPI0013B43B80|nr:hypothetical protein [Leifsonia aquatica]